MTTIAIVISRRAFRGPRSTMEARGRSRLVRSGKAIAVVLALVAVALAAAPVQAAERNAYVVTPLVSNNPALAPTVDPLLVNAWGLVAGPTTPWWSNAADTDRSLLYNAAGAKLALEVTVHGGPTDIVFNGQSGVFLVGTAT